MEDEIWHALDRCEAETAIRAVVLTGAGRGFNAGFDIAELANISDAGAKHTRPDHETGDNDRLGYNRIALSSVPVIAAINGPAVGLGFVIASLCDIRIMADNAILSTAFSRRGLIAEHGIAWQLPRLVGYSAAYDLLLTARRVDAAEALRIGLVSRVVPAAELMEAAMQVADDLAENVSPVSVQVMKQQLLTAANQSRAEATSLANEYMARSFTTADFAEGVAHFVEKRTPAFPGR
jgi:enoyl-CoA hydratase/carnithine racemase